MPRCSDGTSIGTIGVTILFGAILAGCSDLYLDRRETVALGADDAVATNRIVQTIDPWSAASANRRYVFNGDKMRSAAERYRTGKIIQPKGLGTTSAWQQQQQTQSGGATDTDIGAAKSSK